MTYNNIAVTVATLRAQFRRAMRAFAQNCPATDLLDQLEANIDQLTYDTLANFNLGVIEVTRPLVDASTDWPLEARTAVTKLWNLAADTYHHRGRPGAENIANFAHMGALYRGGQPTLEGYAWLVKQGIKSVVSLRDESPDRPVDLANWLQIKYLSLLMIDRGITTFDEVMRFINFINAPEHQPAYVNCRAGIGRTGVMVACWRISQGWSAEEAIQEAVRFGIKETINEAQKKFIRQFELHYKGIPQ